MGDNQSQGGAASGLLGQGGMNPQQPAIDPRKQNSNYGMYRDASGAMQQDRSQPAPPGSVGGPPAGGPQDKAGSQGATSSQQLTGMNKGVSGTPVLPRDAMTQAAAALSKPGMSSSRAALTDLLKTPSPLGPANRRRLKM